jgi:hypothetical protein
MLNNHIKYDLQILRENEFYNIAVKYSSINDSKSIILKLNRIGKELSNETNYMRCKAYSNNSNVNHDE